MGGESERPAVLLTTECTLPEMRALGGTVGERAERRMAERGSLYRILALVIECCFRADGTEHRTELSFSRAERIRAAFLQARNKQA